MEAASDERLSRLQPACVWLWVSDRLCVDKLYLTPEEHRVCLPEQAS